jgi:hypothetical protein
LKEKLKITLHKLLSTSSIYMKNMEVILEPYFKAMLGGYTPQEIKDINKVLDYALSLVGTPYRWHRDGDAIQGYDKFWSANEGPVPKEYICSMKSSIVCSGLTNLMRRQLGKNIPGIPPLELSTEQMKKNDGSLIFTDDGKPYTWKDEGRALPGTTGVWFRYLLEKGRLEPIDVKRKYPKGTMILKDFVSVDGDQGHVVILFNEDGETILDQTIIHSYPVHGYNESMAKGIVDVGMTGLTNFKESHYWGKEAKEPGYYTHICLPENWLLKD